ncbi:glycoside hydrolase family 16 protein [Streptomyces narbonensis]|uniref:glycoside hydrolase family 16 protein n=1 Tax=Streptomyces narbonensis TaxID=67333 RepID=UPI00167234E3|nr:glycoside hydrolase family 16 protein [Streptomyces narbonensis]GGV99714.1 beta-glucanase [Streptomyces narbonensis]
MNGKGARRSLRRAAALALSSVLLLTAAACGGTAEGSGAGPTGAATAGPTPPDDWRLVLDEDFDGTELDDRMWTTCYDWNKDGCTNSGNDELQWYLPEQVSVRDGELTLTAERRETRGSDGRTYPWTSGMISTGRDDWYGEPRRTFTYGYFEASIRIPAEAGMFPAFWLMPDSRFTPPEIDIMEFLDTTREVSMYVHWRDEDGDEDRQRGTYGPVDFPAEFHVFGLLWEPHKLVWYVDGVERLRVTDTHRIPDVPMEILINLAVGVPKAPPASVDSARMDVDWVRVWEER